MKARKVMITIEIEALSIDVLPHLLSKVVEQVDAEMVSGELNADDGDFVSWTTRYKEVTF